MHGVGEAGLRIFESVPAFHTEERCGKPPAIEEENNLLVLLEPQSDSIDEGWGERVEAPKLESAKINDLH